MPLKELAALLRDAPSGVGAAALTKQVQLCRSPGEVGELFAAFSHEANAINVTAMLCRLSKVRGGVTFAGGLCGGEGKAGGGCTRNQQRSSLPKPNQPMPMYKTNPSHTLQVAPPAAALPLARAADLAALVFELRGVAEELLPSCRPRELATLAAALARLGAADRRTLQLLLPRCAPLRALRARELAQLAWAVARSEYNPDADWVAALAAASGEHLARAARAAARRGADAGCAVDEAGVRAEWGWAAEEEPPPGQPAAAVGGSSSSSSGGRAGDVGDAMLPREAATVAWAMATLHRRCILLAAGSGAAAGAAPRCARVDAGWRAALRRVVLAGLCEFGPADLSMALWALAALGDAPPRPWLEAAAARAAALAPVMQERHVAATLWAVSRLQRAAAGRAPPPHHSHHDDAGGVLPPDAVDELCGALQRRLLALLPRLRRPALNAAVVLASLARLGARPDPAFLAALLAPMGAVLEANARAAPPLPASAAEAALAAAAAAEDIERTTAASAAAAAYAGGHGGNDNGAASAAAAQARLLAHAARAAARELSRPRGWQPRDLATVAWALARLGYRPPAPWLAAAAAAAARWLHAFKGRELSLLAHSLAALGAAPPALLAGAARVALMHPGHVGAVDAALLLRALARCKGAYRPGPTTVARLLQLFLSRADDAGGAGGAAALVCAAAALPAVVRPGQLRRLPGSTQHAAGGELLARLAAAARARLGDCDAALLARLGLAFVWLRWSPGAGWVAAYDRRAAELLARGGGAAAAEEAALRAALRALLALHARAEAAQLRQRQLLGRQVEENGEDEDELHLQPVVLPAAEEVAVLA